MTRTTTTAKRFGSVFAILALLQGFSVQPAFGFYETLTAPHERAKVGVPVRLKIPGIRVNAAIRDVGLAPDGSMALAKSARDTGWYMRGPKPGEIGTAVIAGHVNWVMDWLYGTSGVFAKLNTLKPGDIITVQDDTGTSTQFIVRTSRIYNHKDNATDIFHSYDGEAHLNLVTCTGVWDKKAKTYSQRLVVFADKVVK
ncbi:MAG: class F sortase [Patescibacteria group bacterium]|jgi:LPXTG-site transpeptidase (sortase) family protein